jgi:FKBP-type peptidyl-prolyl cis-trans isomerase 2
MAIKGLDDALNGKEVGKEHSIEIKPEEAFGKRDPNMVKMIPLRAFIQQKVYPEKGMQLSLDGMIVKILSNSGGRVLVDFNNPIAGREVIYKFTIIKKIEEIKEKVNALQEFFFRKKFDFELKDKKIIFTVQKGLSKFLEAVSKPIEEILGLSIEIKETDIKEKTEDKTEKTFPKENSNK